MPALFCAIASACSSKWIFAEARCVALAIDQSIFNMMSRGPIENWKTFISVDFVLKFHETERPKNVDICGFRVEILLRLDPRRTLDICEFCAEISRGLKNVDIFYRSCAEISWNLSAEERRYLWIFCQNSKKYRLSSQFKCNIFVKIKLQGPMV